MQGRALAKAKPSPQGRMSMIVVDAHGNIGALASAVCIEPAQEHAPFALELRLRLPARDQRRAVARPGDAERPPSETSPCPCQRRQSLASRIETGV